MTTQTASYTGNEPISLADAKKYLKVDFESEDALIESLIASARRHAEEYLNLKIRPQNVTVTFNDYQDRYFLNGPVTAVTSVKIADEAGTETATPDYVLNRGTLPATLHMTGQEPDGALWVIVTYTAGFTDTEVPENVIRAMYHMIGDWYENRGDGARRFPTVSTRLLDLERINYFA